MKYIFFFLLLFSDTILQGQYDSLYQFSFNDRFEAFRQHIFPYYLHKDSLAFRQKMEDLSSFADSKNDKNFSLEIELLMLEKETDGRYTDHKILISAFQRLMTKANHLGDPRLQAMVFCYAGNYFWGRRSDHSRAIQYYEKAYSLSKQIKDEDFFFKQQIIYLLGEKYFYLTDYHNAILFLNEASQVVNPWMPLHPMISIYNTKGLAHKSLGQIDSAEYCFNKALEYAHKANAKVWIGNLSGNLGSIYIMNGDLEKGIKLLQIDKNISLNRNSKNSAAGALLELSKLNLKLGNFDKSIEQLDSSLLLSTGNIPYPRKKSIYELLSDIHKYRGDYKMALAYLDSAGLVRDSLARQDNAIRSLRLQQRIELEESRAEIAKTEADNKRKTILLYSLITGLFLAIGGGFLLFRQKQKTETARKLSDKLLLNILPANIAAELKATGSAKAKKFQQVTVLFSDFKSFTVFAEELAPEELVKILDDYFRKFDAIIAANGLEKIKTIGDAYMCVCGLPNPEPHHAIKIVQAAIEIQKVVKESPYGWQLRIGIHSGPVVAGIVGDKKFAYDIWGDTVNTAARMEQNSEQGKINISKDTYMLVKEKYACTYRGEVMVKNKGALEMYFVD